MTDLFIGAIPPVGTLAPLLGPALVTAAAKKGGFTVKQFDFNLDFYEHIKHEINLLEWLNTDSFKGNETLILDQYLDEAMERWIQVILSVQPRWIGISIFSYRCFYVLERLLPKIRKAYPLGKIVIGGSGILNKTRAENLGPDLADAIIFGEGETAIIEILSGKTNDSGSTFHRKPAIANLDSLPLPDYSDLNVGRYGYLSARTSVVKPSKRIHFFLEGSRGCVRKCNFCDIPYSIPGYRFRSVESILEEVKYLYESFKLEIIYFTDSLVNGSPTHLKKLCKELILYQNQINCRILWIGYFIIRPAQIFVDEDFSLLAKSGCLQLQLGIESGSNKVRLEMNKKISNFDIDFTLTQCFKNRIGVVALLMVGYPTETENDFLETLDFLERNCKSLQTISSAITCSWRVSIFENTSELNKNQEKYSIKVDCYGEWYTEVINTAVSVKRYFRLIEVAKNLNIKVIDKVSGRSIENFLSKYQIKIQDLSLSEKELTEKYLSAISKATM